MGAVLASKKNSAISAEPIFATPSTPGRKSDGDKVAWIAGKIGQPLMPWQAMVAQVGKEIDADTGMPAYREVVVTVMRQNGKTTLLLAVECEELWKPNHRVAYTAQSGVDGRQKFVEDQTPLLENSPLNEKVRQYYKAADNTGMWWKNGSRLKVLNVGQSAGHGKTLDLAVVDEAFADTNDQREQALRPAMVTKPSAQIWNISTAGTPASTYLRRKVELGRAAVIADKRDGLAYFEWAIPDDEDVYSPDVWAKYMPAYGVTISERVLRIEAENMKEGEFRRAYGNQWTETEERIIPAEWWRAVTDPTVRCEDPLYAIDARVDHSSACVVKADANGRVELVAQRPGVDWLREAVPEKITRGVRLLVDGYGPASHIADDLERQSFNIIRADSLEVRKACGRFYDAVADRKIAVRADERLDAAVAAALKRSTADTWAWHREQPGGELLIAMSLAYNLAVTENVFTPFAWT